MCFYMLQHIICCCCCVSILNAIAAIQQAVVYKCVRLHLSAIARSGIIPHDAQCHSNPETGSNSFSGTHCAWSEGLVFVQTAGGRTLLLGCKDFKFRPQFCRATAVFEGSLKKTALSNHWKVL